MKNKDLIAHLSKLDPEAEVFVQEGRGIGEPNFDIASGTYVKDGETQFDDGSVFETYIHNSLVDGQSIIELQW